jgi:hypothetical protein
MIYKKQLNWLVDYSPSSCLSRIVLGGDVNTRDACKKKVTHDDLGKDDEQCSK